MAMRVTLDVRPDLAAGKEPFSRILAAARKIPPGGALVLLAPFEPVPLYAVLGRQGFTVSAESLGGEEGFRVTFVRTALEPG